MLVFISYRRADSDDIVGRIYDRLAARFGKEFIFKDVDAIPLGSDFRQIIDKAISNCQVLLALIGRDWLTVTESDGSRRLENPRDYVRVEIETALERDIPVIPVLVRGAKMPSALELPLAIRNLTYRSGIPIRSDPDFNEDIKRLIKSIELLIPNAENDTPSQGESKAVQISSFREGEKKRILKDIEIYQKEYNNLIEDIKAVIENLETADNNLTRKRLQAQKRQLEEERQPIVDKLTNLKAKLVEIN